MENNFNGFPKPDEEKKDTIEQSNTENTAEAEMNQEILKLETNLEGLQQDIDNMGGEEKLQEELEKNDLLANRFKDRYERTKNAILGSFFTLGTATLGGMSAYIEPQLNRALEADRDMGNMVTGAAILSLILAVVTIKDFIKHQKRVSKANELSGT